jgi:hypothetical protein
VVSLNSRGSLGITALTSTRTVAVAPGMGSGWVPGGDDSVDCGVVEPDGSSPPQPTAAASAQHAARISGLLALERESATRYPLRGRWVGCESGRRGRNRESAPCAPAPARPPCYRVRPPRCGNPRRRSGLGPGPRYRAPPTSICLLMNPSQPPRIAADPWHNSSSRPIHGWRRDSRSRRCGGETAGAPPGGTGACAARPSRRAVGPAEAARARQRGPRRRRSPVSAGHSVTILELAPTGELPGF